MNAIRKVASKASKNWLRIDMYDSKNGPVFGEITPWSTNGLAAPRASCAMSYLFTAHAYNNGYLDDAATIVMMNFIFLRLMSGKDTHKWRNAIRS